MPEFPPIEVERDAASDAPKLTADPVEAILDDFRTWFAQRPSSEPSSNGAAEGASLDLHTLLSQFVTLRHEVNLQTRAVRAQQEQNAETLTQLREALRAAAPPAPNPSESKEEIRSAVKTLIDIHDALSIGQRGTPRTRDAVLQRLNRLSAPPAVAPVPSSWLSRLWQPTAPAPIESNANEERAELGRQLVTMIDGLLTGYSMSLQRVERSLTKLGVEPMTCVGRIFDPEMMEVVEVMESDSHNSGEVVEEFRSGYTWNGRPFRFAQVKVARLRSSTASAD